MGVAETEIVTELMRKTRKCPYLPAEDISNYVSVSPRKVYCLLKFFGIT